MAIDSILEFLLANQSSNEWQAMNKEIRSGTFKSPLLKLVNPSTVALRELQRAGTDMYLDILGGKVQQEHLDHRLQLKKLDTAIRQGSPPIRTQVSIPLDVGESCYLETSAYFKKHEKTGWTHSGNLFATNRKVLFLYDGGGWQIPWKRVISIEGAESHYGGGELAKYKGFGAVRVRLTTQRGDGDYHVAEPDLVAAIIEGLRRVARGEMHVLSTDAVLPKTARQLGMAIGIERKDRTGIAFELKCMELLQMRGFQVTLTNRTSDGGIDLVALSNDPVTRGKYVVQCKDWSNPVGAPVVRDLYGVVHAEDANKGILITSSSFTEGALEFANGKKLELIDGKRLNHLLSQ